MEYSTDGNRLSSSGMFCMLLLYKSKKSEKDTNFWTILYLKHIPSVDYSVILSYIRAISVNKTPVLEYFIC